MTEGLHSLLTLAFSLEKVDFAQQKTDEVILAFSLEKVDFAQQKTDEVILAFSLEKVDFAQQKTDEVIDSLYKVSKSPFE